MGPSLVRGALGNGLGPALKLHLVQCHSRYDSNPHFYALDCLRPLNFLYDLFFPFFSWQICFILFCSMYMLYQQLRDIEGMELSKAIWYSGTFGSYYELIVFLFHFYLILVGVAKRISITTSCRRNY